MTLIEQLRSKKKALTVEELAGLLCVAVRTLTDLGPSGRKWT
jgi:hypothetical protein